MRISTSMIYSQAISNFNKSLSDLVRANDQTTSQKKINAPSDDPAGYARVLDLSTENSELDQYIENIGTANSWLELADSELDYASDLITKLIELAEQGATGTYSDDELEIIAQEARELYEELVATANAEFAGDSIFAGTAIDGNAYEMSLGSTVLNDDSGTVNVLQVEGSADYTIYVEFENSGTVGTDAINYRYSTDGGETWVEDTLTAGDTVLDLGTARATMASGSQVTATAEAGGGDGTVMLIRPTATYLGNDDEGSTTVRYGNSAVSAVSEGNFSSTVTIRVDSGNTLDSGIEYSYSLDNGVTWSEGHITSNGTFSIPGGTVELSSNGGNSVTTGEQFVVKPYSGVMEVKVGPYSSVQINNIGMDIFGGLYTYSGGTYATVVGQADSNLFEVVGELVAYLETNNSDGAAKCLETLSAAQEKLTVALGDVGGRETRLEFAQYSVETMQDATTASISNIEDADVGELSVALSKAQYVYGAVLESYSKIMGMSLLDYL